MPLPVPENELQRLVFLRESQVLDSEPDSDFDDVTQLAVNVCKVPMSAISLIDADRQWFKSTVGLSFNETPRDVSFCAHTILQSTILEVSDTHADPRFSTNPLVTGQPNVRFYAAAPLITSDGLALGSLCIYDRIPRTLSTEQKAILKMLARQVAGRIELLRRAALQHHLLTNQERLLDERTRAEEALRQSEEELRAVFDQAMEGIYLFEPKTKQLLKTNEALRSMLGYSEEHANSLTVYDIIAHDRGSIDRHIEDLAMKGELAVGERQYLHRDGSVLVVEVRGRLVRHSGADAFCVSVHDVTERRRAEAAQQEAEHDFYSLFENAVEGIFRTTLAGTYLQTNPALARIYGYESTEDLLSKLTDIDCQLYVDAGRRSQFQEIMVKEGRVSDFESRVRRQDGVIIWISESARPVYDVTGAFRWYEGFVQDISERKAFEAEQSRALQEAQDSADLDPLTGLFNHRAFQRRLQSESDRAERDGSLIAVVMLDLDNFKFFNEVYGHILGDQVLMRVAERLKAICRPYDTVARFGGDEFALVLPGIEQTACSEIEARLRSDLSDLTFHPDDGQMVIPLTISVGAALLSPLVPDRQDTLRVADERLRRAKTGADVETEADQMRAIAAISMEGFPMLDALVAAVDNKDRYTRQHSVDVMVYSLVIARELKMDEQMQLTVAVAALIHDVGKIGVPDAVLRKPGKLTESEFDTIKQHPEMGAAIVGAVPALAATLDAVRHHHERWDGGGYPYGLKGRETPLIARLMAVADAYSAMTTDRPYRKSMGMDRAMAVLEVGAGTQWDPECVMLLLQHLRGKVREICR